MDDAERYSEDAVAEYVAAEIRAQLARKRISGREAARRLGWHQTSMARRMTARQPIEVGHIFEIASLLNVPVEQFFPPRELAGVGSRKAPSWAARLAA